MVHHPSTIAPCQSPKTPCLSACHTHQSITLLPQLSFLLLNVVFFIVVLVTIESVCGCDGMHHLFAPIISTLCVSLWCHPVWLSLCFGALDAVPVVHHALCFISTCTTFGQWMLLSGTHVASHSPHAIHFTSHSTLLLASKCLPMMVSTSKSFGKSPLHTGPIHQPPPSECLPAPHITPHGSMGQQ